MSVLPASNIANRILARIGRDDAGTAILEVHGEPEQSRTEFLRRIASRVGQLAESLHPGDRVLCATGRGSDYFVDMLATWALGGVFVPFDPCMAPDQVAFLRDTTASSLTLDSRVPAPQGVSPGNWKPEHCYPVDEQNPCAILFTSGSTGTPKGVTLSHRSLFGNSSSTLERLGIDGDRLFMNTPFQFTSAICHFLACALSGSTLVTREQSLLLRQLPEALFEASATGFGGAPVQLQWIVDYLREDARSMGSGTTSSLQFVMSSGDHLPQSVVAALREVAPQVAVHTVYGLTELGGRFCMLPPEEVTLRPGSVGKPIEGLSVAIYDSSLTRRLPAGEEGEIVAAGKWVFGGYHGNPDATGRVMTEVGVRTGDIGWLDAEGYLYLHGRSDDVFKVNGQKVSALVINEALLATGFFRDVAVIAAERVRFGTVPIAFVVPQSGEQFSKGSTLRCLRGTIPNNHVPHEFIVLKQIPRTGSGKLKRADLRACAPD